MQVIMVFPRDFIDGIDGFIPWDDAKNLMDSVSKKVIWMPRDDAERSKIWVQPIPCAILRDSLGRYCVFRQIRQQRKDLSSRLSFFVGGHVDHCSIGDDVPSIFYETVRREVREEIGVTLDDTPTPVGVVVDGSSLMASRHIGFVYEIRVDSNVKSQSDEEFSTRSKYNGKFLDIADRSRFRGTFDPWSSIVFSQYMEGGFATDVGRQLMLPLY